LYFSSVSFPPSLLLSLPFLSSLSALYLSTLSLPSISLLCLFPCVSFPLLSISSFSPFFFSLLSLLYISPLCISLMFLSISLAPLYLWSSVSLFCLFSSVYHPVSSLCLSSE
jgi:hypothetical protein